MDLKEAQEKFKDLLMQLDTPPTLFKDKENNIYLKIGENSSAEEDEFSGGDIGDLDDAMG